MADFYHLSSSKPPLSISNSVEALIGAPSEGSTVTMTKVPRILSKSSSMHSGGDGVGHCDSAAQPRPDSGTGYRAVATDLSRDAQRATVSGGRHTSPPKDMSSESSVGVERVKRGRRVFKLIDDSFMWTDVAAAAEALLDQSDYVVIGVLGCQGVGKSTIVSALAGVDVTSLHNHRSRLYAARSTSSTHNTDGVDMYVTTERTILLDSQPVLSASVLDYLIRQDKKPAAASTSQDYAGIDNTAELQSLQIATFLLTVCNVVVVTMDSCLDMSMLSLLQLAEMVKPSTPTSSQNGLVAVTGVDNADDFCAHIVFVLNRAHVSHFHPDCMLSMQTTVQRLMRSSRLKYAGVKLSPSRKWLSTDVNLVLLPCIGAVTSVGDDDGPLTSGYFGHDEFEHHMRKLIHGLLAVPRRSVCPSVLTEKLWLAYAAKSWDVIRKSQLLAEFSRLQS